MRKLKVEIFPLLVSLVAAACTEKEVKVQSASTDATKELNEHCQKQIGAPRIIELTPNVFVAIGYDLANVTLIKTSEGNVIIDAGLSVTTAKRMKKALLAKAPGPIKALIFTHSHLDHVGGASVWLEAGTKIWGTAAFAAHFFKQYGLLRLTEQLRGGRMYGLHVADADLGCLGIGERIRATDTAATGARLPTETFSEKTSFQVGATRFDLIEAPGETHDNLTVFIPSEKVVALGDNFYSAFPNLYTIRGTAPRPVDKWIDSLDDVRRLDPDFVVPGHTLPLVGKSVVRETLRNYRDAVAWVFNSTIAGANRQESPNELSQLKLPEHLANLPYLTEFYGQIDWSVKGIYSSQIGWFDGKAQNLYPADEKQTTKREVEMMGGEERILAEAHKAKLDNDPRWAAHLLAKLLTIDPESKVAKQEMAEVLRLLAFATANTNGRGYLLESASELEKGAAKLERPTIDDELAKDIPLRVLLAVLTLRARPDRVDRDVTESVRMNFPDVKQSFAVTYRKGVVEITEGAALPETPEPIATVTTDSLTFKKIATKSVSRVKAIATGKFKVAGSIVDYVKFMRRFDLD